ncbi:MULTISPECIES: iron ABC transporter permease [unclassified Ochrobactrum]|uniref:FecCD family ABC transporter permease n=1 Tax=unclassified Ochrobactrum TaxID=239106 RepID=UPI000DEFFB15|nr:iron ABC transporter permease [Ochrobactrum sp. 3-3]MBQ0708669.1 iron ABC transporter permease [Ochrobactrum sp. AP1BH01-1]
MTERSRFYLLLVGLALLVALLFIVSLLTGPAVISISDSFKALFGDDSEMIVLVMREIRLPRALLALLIGASLGLSGAALQGYLRNPLAEPGLLGVSASASCGAVIAIYTGLSLLFPLALPLLALTGAFASVFFVKLLAGRNAGALAVILAGVAVTSLAGALTALALNLSPNPFAAMEIVFWMLGSLADRSMTHVALSAPFILIGWTMLVALGRSLDSLTLGADAAATMGVNLARVQLFAVLGTAACVGASTAVAGAIGFVGLVVPHLLRPLVGARPSRLLVASGFGGAALLLAADILVRVVMPGRELKLGVLTAIIGAPFFLWLVFKYRRQLV